MTRPPDGRADRPVLAVDLEGLSLAGMPILGPIGFELAAMETVALVGPSGIGKSTLLRCIAGLERGYRGRIAAPEATAMIFQEPTLLPWRSLAANLRIATGIGAGGAVDLLRSVGLGGRDADFPSQLSLGQQRRLALARAFATRPTLLLMDEPFVSLDPELADEMMRLFARLRTETGTTTLLVTHVEEEAERLATRVIALGGAPAEIVGDRTNAPSL